MARVWRGGGGARVVTVGIIKVRRPGTVFILAPNRSAADERISGFVLYIYFFLSQRRRCRVLYNIMIIIIRCTMSVCAAVQNKKSEFFGGPRARKKACGCVGHRRRRRRGTFASRPAANTILSLAVIPNVCV